MGPNRRGSSSERLIGDVRRSRGSSRPGPGPRHTKAGFRLTDLLVQIGEGSVPLGLLLASFPFALAIAVPLPLVILVRLEFLLGILLHVVMVVIIGSI